MAVHVREQGSRLVSPTIIAEEAGPHWVPLGAFGGFGKAGNAKAMYERET